MTHLSARLSPPNSLLLVLDPRTGKLPDTLAGAPIAATSSGIAIGTLTEIDGETEVHLSDAAIVPEDSDLVMRWEGELATAGRLGILTIDSHVLMELEVGETVNVQIWTNAAAEPNIIWVTAAS
jgi:hypothetical protein